MEVPDDWWITQAGNGTLWKRGFFFFSLDLAGRTTHRWTFWAEENQWITHSSKAIRLPLKSLKKKKVWCQSSVRFRSLMLLVTTLQSLEVTSEVPGVWGKKKVEAINHQKQKFVHWVRKITSKIRTRKEITSGLLRLRCLASPHSH